MKKFKQNEDAFTGLEAAIVLIAFVVVAAVFSYVVLGAGFFTTQKSQEVVHTGVGQASSNMELSGPVVVEAAAADQVGSVSFYLQLAAGGTPVDMSKVTYTVSTKTKMETYVDGDAVITRTDVGSESDSDNLLENREMMMITIALTDFAGADKIDVNDQFTIEVKPDIGAALPLVRKAPGGMSAGSFYEVY
jgi:flagellin FlaB